MMNTIGQHLSQRHDLFIVVPLKVLALCGICAQPGDKSVGHSRLGDPSMHELRRNTLQGKGEFQAKNRGSRER